MHRNLVTATRDTVLRINIDQIGLMASQFHFVIHREGGDDQDVTRCGTAGSRAIDRNDARSAFGADGVGGETLAVVYVPDVDLFVFLDVGRFEQVFINGAGTLVVQIGVGGGHAVQLGFQHCSLHGFTHPEGWGKRIVTTMAPLSTAIIMDILAASNLDVVNEPRRSQSTGGKHHQWGIYAFWRG